MQQPESVAIFWDFENLPPSLNTSGYEVIESIRSLAQAFGSVILFKAYLEVTSLTSSNLRTELQASGVSLTDCPHNGRKDVVDKMLIADMVAFAIDHRPPATIILISEDRDYAYAVSLLRFRQYQVVVACPSTVHNSLLAQASVHLDWNPEMLAESSYQERSSSSKPQGPSTPFRRRASSAASRAFAPSIPKPNLDGDGDDDFLCGPRLDAGSHSTRVNGAADEKAPYTPHNNDRMSWRQFSSRTPSRPYSPPASFRSAKSSPPTPPPIERKASEPTFVTIGEGLFESSSKPTLPRGFPFIDTEPTVMLQAQLSTPKEVPPPAPIPSSLPTPAPSFPPVPLPDPVPASTPTPGPPSLPTPAPLFPSVPLPVPVPASTPTPGPALAPMPSPPSATLKLPETSKSVFRPTPPSAPALSTLSAAPAPATPTPASKSTSLPGSAAPQTSKLTAANGTVPPKKNINTIAAHFRTLITVLEARSRADGSRKVSRSNLGNDLAKHKSLYGQAKVSSFASYMLLATNAGIVDAGGSGSGQWITLRPEWSSSTTFPASS